MWLVLPGCKYGAPPSPLTIKGYSSSPRMLNFSLDQKDQINAILPEHLRLKFRYAAVDSLIVREVLVGHARAKGLAASGEEVKAMFRKGEYRLSGHRALLPLSPGQEPDSEFVTTWLK